ncbi:HEPN domain-containing protein [Dyadobacter sp. CY356]|uniref:HEPN domain-containing protein n=1 Tax=Dyadobacter sp. CY356 TaxID=2906442 RepID=UPI001F248BA1|nr:HEPN domain-containing protein [Dyadobacter sp. CY356]MCF0059052.1 HEPN domain-containing protein [Dyadobacter sp. CY356]
MKINPVDDIISKAVDCYDDSKEFLAKERYEAALNRSYYSMFHCIQALLSTVKFVAKSHSGAHNAFHKEFILTQRFSKDLGLALKRTFEKRQFGNYEYDEVLYEDAKESVDDAQKFLVATTQYLKENNFLK